MLDLLEAWEERQKLVRGERQSIDFSDLVQTFDLAEDTNLHVHSIKCIVNPDLSEAHLYEKVEEEVKKAKPEFFEEDKYLYKLFETKEKDMVIRGPLEKIDEARYAPLASQGES